jgi:hypothetical protein
MMMSCLQRKHPHTKVLDIPGILPCIVDIYSCKLAVTVALTVGFERGTEREWLQIHPSALASWEAMRLEPCSTRRNIRFLSVHLDMPDMTDSVRLAMAQLSAVYELCQLGSHTPLESISWLSCQVRACIVCSSAKIKRGVLSYRL